MLENARWKFCWKQQRQLLVFPSAGKTFKPISGSYAWKTASCLQFQVYHAVKKSVAWEPLRYTCSSLCSSSQRVHQPPQAHDQGSIMSCHRLVPTGRSGDHPLGCQESFCLICWLQEITRFVQSISINAQIVPHHLVLSALSFMWYRREWDEFKHAEIHCNWHQGLIVRLYCCTWM